MKIAILYFQDIKKPLAGDSTYLSNLSHSLIEEGHEVEILSLFGPQSKSNLWEARLKRSIYSAYIFAKAARISRYDIVLFAEPLYPFNMVLLRYLKFLTKAHIVLNEIGAPRIKDKFYYLPIRNKFPVLINGESARHFAESIATEVELLPPCVDTTKLYPLDIDKKWDLLYIGHLYKEKGVLLLLHAMKRLKDTGSRLKLKILCTPCAEEKFYRRYIRENGLDNVDMETAIITDHISVYNSARAFVYPGLSHNRVAQFPLTILEASACGLPVVCTTLYRHIELPNITFADPAPESLQEAILRIADNWNPDKRDQTIAVIRERYSVSSMGSIAESFFAQVIAGESKVAQLSQET
jgi:glycosyltransferase involved in cell wall biosynthesis